MKACHSCGEALHHPNTGHTVICPSCGTLFDFENPDSPPEMALELAAQLPPSPLKSRARWVAIIAIASVIGVMVAASQNPPKATEIEQTP